MTSLKPIRSSPAVFGLLFLGVALPSLAADVEENKLPPSAKVQADFERDVKPIFEKTCFRCHGPEKPKSHFRLDNRESALKGGENNHDDIVPGDSMKSKLIHYVTRLVEDMEMPPPGKGEPLTPEQISLLRAWIDQGAKWPAGAETVQRETQFSIAPTAQWVTVSGNKQKFREDALQKEGFTAGYEHFEMRQPVGQEAELQVEGRALFDQNDHRVSLTLSQPDFGFVRGGYGVYRKYFNDTGGYYAPFNQSSPALERNLFLDNGKAWFEAGLTLPDWPKLVMGYEYQFKKGDESTLQWGQYSNDPTAPRATYPGYKVIDEHTHVLKLEVTHELRGYSLEDNFRAEFYDLSTTRINRGDLFTPDAVGQYTEGYSHFQAANSFRLEKQLSDWLFVSGGYLYTHLEGAGSFNQVFSSVSSSFPTFVGDTSDRISLKQQSHTINFNAMLGPWEGLTLASGFQSEWTRREGLTDLFVQSSPPPAPGEQNSNEDRTALDENVALRYTKIPFTVLYAEARLEQEWTDYYDHQFLDDGSDDSRDFTRDSNAKANLKEYRAGFTVSPWTRVSFEPSYKHSDHRTDYNNKVDTDLSQPPFVPGDGYPAFFRSRDVTTDEVDVKLVLRPSSWLKATLQYQLLATDYRTTTDSSFLPGFPTNIFYPGGELLAGNYDAHVYSANVTLTPWRRLYLSTTFSCSQSRILTGANNGATVVPYRGDIYSVLSSASLALNNKTDLRAGYTFSRADYRQHNEVAGLPLGIFYERHGLMAGLTRRLLKNMTGTLQYVFFYYNEPTSNGANNYRAHAVLASLNVALP